MLTTQQMIQHYMDNLEALEVAADTVDDPLSRAAVVAFSHIVDDTVTEQDLTAYRAWLTHLRLTGFSEDAVRTGVEVADHVARKLGVA